MTLIDDKYEGITIDNSTIPKSLEVFEKELVNILDNSEDKKLLWIKVPLGQVTIIPILTKYDFIFYNCNEKELMLLKKLITNPIIPTATNHTLGVGAVVIEDNKLLVIKDRIWQKYKLPGGYIDDKESISTAVKREVFEETGVIVELDSIVSLGHFYPTQFDESNLYIVCSAKALSTKIEIGDSEEIIDAKWMNIDDYFACKDIHEYNKNIVKTAVKEKGLKLKNYDYFMNADNTHEYYF